MTFSAEYSSFQIRGNLRVGSVMLLYALVSVKSIHDSSNRLAAAVAQGEIQPIDREGAGEERHLRNDVLLFGNQYMYNKMR